MREAYLKNRIIAVLGAAVLLALCFVMPCKTYASDDDASLMERSVWFTYECTDCLGETFTLDKEQIGYYAYPSYFGLDMMLCDTDHVVHVAGDGVTADNVTLTSLNPDVLEIDSAGHVTLHKTGTAEITAIVAADNTYKECTVSLGVTVRKHDGMIETEQVHYEGRSPVWGMDLDTSDGPQQLVVPLRPGASVSYSVDDPKIATVDQNGVVTPLSAGTVQIWVNVDDGGGRYNECRFVLTIKVTGDDAQGGQTDDPVERSVWFTYECTDCLGETFRLDKEQIGYYEYPSYFGLDMMLCDTDHVVRVEGDGVTADNVTLISLNPDVLGIDSDGHVTLHKAGRAEIRATVAADSNYKECTVTLAVTVGRHDGWIGTEQVHFAGRSPAWGLELDTSNGPQQLVVPLRPGANVSYSIDDPKIATVDQNGLVTPVSPGYVTIRFYVDDGGGKYKAGYFEKGITVTGESTQGGQDTAGGNDSADEEAARKAAEEAARKAEEEAARKAEEEAAQKAAAEAARKADEEAARKAAEEAVLKSVSGTAQDADVKASQKTADARSKALKRPRLRAKALRGNKIKLKWSKVANADGYIIYVKYPGRKKYVKATVRNATVKAVTHRGLSKGKVYRYKVRAYKKVKGKIHYSPYSKVRKARVR